MTEKITEILKICHRHADRLRWAMQQLQPYRPFSKDTLQQLSDVELAARLYHARKISFASAAQMAGLGFESFQARLTEHFSQGFIVDDEIVLEDIATVQKLSVF